MALRIRVDGTKEEIKGSDKNGSLTLDQMKEAIGGGYIELVACDPEVTGGYNQYVCDEEGKLKDFKANALATSLSTYTAPNDVVVGDVLFCVLKGEELY